MVSNSYNDLDKFLFWKGKAFIFCYLKGARDVYKTTSYFKYSFSVS